MKRSTRTDSAGPLRKGPLRLPKLTGADVEVANFVEDSDSLYGSGREASGELLKRFDGLPGHTWYTERSWRASDEGSTLEDDSSTALVPLDSNNGGDGSPGHDTGSGSRILSAGGHRSSARSTPYASGYSSSPYQDGYAYGDGAYGYSGSWAWGCTSQDYGRKFLPANGGCAYIDLSHLELCIPEVLSARGHVAAYHAMLRLAGEALHAANQERSADRRIRVLVNSSDGQDHSYGAHLNVLITRRCYDNIFNRRLHLLLLLGSFQVSMIVITGQGKVGSEDGAPWTPFQLSQRADFFTCIVAAWTTHNRPLVNSRNEALVGNQYGGYGTDRDLGEVLDSTHARVHCIFHDASLSEAACLLKVGLMQILLCMLEAEVPLPFESLALEDPLAALHTWSHDPGLSHTARTVDGSQLTAVDLQSRFYEAAADFVEGGGCEGFVPGGAEIIELWGDTLNKLQRRDIEALAPRLDWTLKYSILQGVLDQRKDLDWKSPELKVLDHLYSSLDEDGLFWKYNAGFMERVVSEEEILDLMAAPPEDTRAYARAHLLRRAGAEGISAVDWDSMRFKIKGSGRWPDYRTLQMHDPLSYTRAETREIFSLDSLTEILDALEHIGKHVPVQ